MKSKASVTVIAILVVSACLLLSCKKASDNAGVLTIYSIKGPSGICMLPMFENPPQIKGFEVQLEALAQADLIAAKFISGEAKMGMLPPNVAAKIASSGKNIKIAAVTGNGMISLLSSDSDVRSIDDLKGKKVDLAGAGATPDYVFRRLLLNHGIDPEKDLELGYALAYPEIALSLAAGRISTVLLPEPFATIAQTRGDSTISRIGDIQDEWSKTYGSVFPMTVFVVDGDFADANNDAMIAILKSLEDSIALIISSPAEAGVLAQKHDMGIDPDIALLAVPKSNYVFIPAVSARPSLETLFGIFLEFSPQSIGNALPGDAFYYDPQP